MTRRLNDDADILYEVAIEILNTMIGQTIRALAEEEKKRNPRKSQLELFTDMRQRYVRERRELDPTDSVAVRRIFSLYAPKSGCD